VDGVLAAEAFHFEAFLLKIENYQRMLPGYFPKVAEVNVYMPNYLHAELLAFLLVVDGRPANYTVKFWHKVAPIAALKNCKATIVEGLGRQTRRFIEKFNLELLPLFLQNLELSLQIPVLNLSFQAVTFDLQICLGIMVNHF